MLNQPTQSVRILKVGATAAVIMSLLITLVLYAGEKLSQKATADSSVPYSQQATTTQISNTKITLRLHFDSGGFADAMQFEGGMIRLEQNGSVLGITPYLEADEVKVKVFKVFPLKNPVGLVAEGLAELNEVMVSKEPTRISNERWGLAIEVVNVEKEMTDGVKNAYLSIQFPKPSPQGGQCCITCPPDPRVCASAVHAPCADCTANSN
jgi:hypothetical protein